MPIRAEGLIFRAVPVQKQYPTPFQRKTLWRAVTGMAILVLGILLVGLIWLTGNVFSYLQPVLVPLAVAGIVAYLLDPIARKLQGRGLSRMKAILIVFSGVTILFGVLAFMVAQPLSQELKSLFSNDKGKAGFPTASLTVEQLQDAKNHAVFGWVVKEAFQRDPEAVRTHLLAGGALLDSEKAEYDQAALDDNVPPDLQERWSSKVALHNFWLTKLGTRIDNTRDWFLTWLMSSGGKLLGYLGFILGFVMVPIYLYYFMKESDSIRDHWHDYVPLKASHFKDEVIYTLKEINGYLISFFRGQVLVAFIDGILVGLALWAYGLPYALLIGVFMAILGIIPFIGNILCLIPACVIAWVHSGGGDPPFDLPQWGYVLGVVIIFVVVQQINSIVTAPKIVGESVGLHPMTVIFSILFWTLILGGFLGALLAVPLTAAIKVLFRRYIWEKKRIRDPEQNSATFPVPATQIP